MLDQIESAEKKSEHEEHFKNFLEPFFNSVGFDDYTINTSGRIDLAIYNGSKSKDPVGVLMEVKRPSNGNEMITKENLNRKAMHEAVLYYLEQRIEQNNSDLKHVIITGMNDWFIFDAQEFERCFYKPSTLRKMWKEWKADRKVSSNNDFMYREISRFMQEQETAISGLWIPLHKTRKLLKGKEDSDYEKKLIPLYKLFTPTHLLKEPFANDSNSLNREFYRELLYILGLEETKKGSTLYIQRAEEDKRHSGSIIENTIRILDSEDHLSTLKNERSSYGANREEQLFSIAMELSITWMNRVLFLKLLEAQLFRYHRQDPKFKFLNYGAIDGLDELNKLFFQVLARKEKDRTDDVNAKFGHIPYLNSSLFDVSTLERQTTRISGLDDHEEIPVYSKSVLTDNRGETLNTLDYLFRFLEAYDFSAEGSEEIRDESKSLINASVLGLIFEKINGYKDGSFYTPGFITEYMARETLRKAVVDKFELALSPNPSPAGGRGAGGEGGDRVEEPGWKLPDSLIENARYLRKNQTDAEELLWGLLRNRQFYNFKFKRQHPIKPGFILDFYCAEKKLAIEVDGSIHDEKDQMLSDEERTQILNEKGIDVIRFKNEDVLNRTDTVLKTLAGELGVYSAPTSDPSHVDGRGVPEGRGEGELTFTDIYNRIGRDISIAEANELINSITICDPAVGSGHFLVSCLNELIAIKSELGILSDIDGKILRGVEVVVENDELIITHGETLFEYDVSHTWSGNRLKSRKVDPEKERIQKTLFREKKQLIENCLFGVDINPNSVKICRLRLWIELLKRAYYQLPSPAGGRGTGGEGGELEVLPNIDINIKQGNSLVSRFELDSDLSSVFSESDYSLDDYKEAVRSYKHTGDRTEKQRLQELIDDIKEEYTTTLTNIRPINKKLSKARGKLELMQSDDLFGDVKFTKKDIKKQKKKVAKLEEEKADEEAGAFYNEAFEWRFEFPEVLDDEGRFTGFDVVIGNPPYVRHENFKEIKPYLKTRYTVYQGTADLYSYFIEQGMDLLTQGGHFQYIVANKWMRANYGKPLREWLQEKVNIDAIYDFGDLPVFEEATTYPCLLQLSKRIPIGRFYAAEIETLDFNNLESYLNEHRFDSDQTKLQSEGWALINAKTQRLLTKLKSNGIPLGKYVEGKIYRGLLTGLNKAFVIDEQTKNRLIEEDASSEELIKPFLAGRDIKRYLVPKTDNYLILVKNGQTNEMRGEKEPWAWFSETYPAIAKYLSQFEEKAKARYDQGQYWWELRACDYYDEFEKNKILWPGISSVVTTFTIDKFKYYGNDNIHLIISDDKFLLGILNSSISELILKNTCDFVQARYYRMKISYIETLNIPDASESVKAEIDRLVSQIITANEETPEADTTELEQEIDRLVYELYGLSEEEIEVVEGGV